MSTYVKAMEMDISVQMNGVFKLKDSHTNINNTKAKWVWFSLAWWHVIMSAWWHGNMGTW